MKSIYDILEEFKNFDSKRVKEDFIEKLNKYILQKYKSVADFTDAYTNFLLEIEQNENTDIKEIERKLKDRAKKNVSNLLNPLSGIKRETIIDIAFILSDSEKKDGEEIANELLRCMHFPKLHASSEIEIFYIYAFRKGLRYSECLSLYKEYLTTEKNCSLQKASTNDTSTVFYNELKNITKKEELFSFVDSKRQYFGIASKKISEIIISTFNKMCFTKFLISCHNNQANAIAEYIANNELFFPNFQKSYIFDQLTVSSFEIFVKQNKSHVFYNELVKMGAQVQIFKTNYRDQMDLILDFFLFFSSDLSLKEFKNEFLELNLEASAMNRNDYSEYIKNYENFNFNFYSIKAKNHNNVDAEGCAFSTVFEGLTKVMNRKNVLSREGLILWLLFYYREDSDKKTSYFRLDDINDFISYRYSRLDERLYFDKFIITILSFSIEEGKLKYNDELIENTDGINIENIHKLRRSIIKQFEYYFDCNYAAEAFVDTNNSTTTEIHKSTRKRLNIG